MKTHQVLHFALAAVHAVLAAILAAEAAYAHAACVALAAALYALLGGLGIAAAWREARRPPGRREATPRQPGG